MSTFRVYRIENDRGEGPYSDSALTKYPVYDCIRQHNGDPARPSPFQQGEPWSVMNFSSAEVFGFFDMEYLGRWFDPHLLTFLLTHGHKVVWYEVPENTLRLGDSGQVSFRKDLALLSGVEMEYSS